MERKIIIGLITSTEYLQQVQTFWDPQLIESATAKRIALWCWEYFNEFKKAPVRDIEGIYFAKLKEGKLAKDIAEEIEQDILPNLSKEFEEQTFTIEYLLIETKKYFTDRHLTIHTESINALRVTGKIEEAEILAGNFKPLNFFLDDIDKHIKSINQIRKEKLIKPPLLLRPWLREGQLTIIYGNFGTGKTLITVSIAYLLSLVEYDQPCHEIGEWQVKKPTGCLYIDGEMGKQEMEERISQFEWLGKQNRKYRLRVLSIPEYQIETEDTFSLSERKNQLKIVQWLKSHPLYKLIILDSASTLFGLVEENDNSEWNTKINPMLRDLRALGVACILLHHSGKDGKRGLRGASAMGAMAQNIYKLTNHPDKKIEEGEAWFKFEKDKQRGAGYSFRTFYLKFTQENDSKETHWEVT